MYNVVDSSGWVCAVWSPSAWIETFHILAAVPVDLKFVREGLLAGIVLGAAALYLDPPLLVMDQGKWSPRA